MTTINVSKSVAAALLAAASESGLRAPVSVTSTTTHGPVMALTWDPDLTPEEQATLDTLTKLAVGSTLLTPADRAAIEPRMVTLRTFRQQSQSEFMAKTANQRDRELFDATNDLIAIVFRLLRD